MKSLRRSFCFAALFLAFGVPAQTPPSPPEFPSHGIPEDLSPGQSVYEVLLAEVALQRGEVELAVRLYADLASRVPEAMIMERAIEVAGFAQQFDLAEEVARRWLAEDPDSAQARKMLLGTLIMSDQLAELAPHLIRVLEDDKEKLTDNLLGLNRSFARSPDRAAVYRLIEAACQPFLGLAEAHYAIALAASGAGLNERARQEVLQALELRPDWEMAAFLLAQMLMRDSREEAIEFAESFLENTPGADQIRLLLARALIGERRYVEARREFDRLEQDAPDDPDIVFAVAMLALQFDDPVLAGERLRYYVTLDKTPDLGSAHYYLGQIAEDARRDDEAMAHYAQVVSGPRHLAAQSRLARLFFAQGKLDEGRDLLHGIRTNRPEERIQLQIVEAALLRETGHLQEAFDFLEARLAGDPENAELIYETALLAERLGDAARMETRLRRVIELRPEHSAAYNALGYAYADRNERLPEARQLIEKALALAPDDAAILDSMGWVLFRLGDLPEALSYLERAYGKQEDPEIAAHLGEALWRMGREEEARRFLREAQEKFPASAVLSETARRLAP